MPIEPRFLRQYVPLNDLTDENLNDLSSKTELLTIPADKSLFKRGESDNKSIYVVAGEVMLLAENGSKESIVGGTPKSKLPIDQHTPRQSTAIAKTEVKYFSVENNYLDLLLSWDKSNSYHVTDLDSSNDDDADWMTNMLQSEIFHRIPASNIQMVIMRMEQMNLSAGEDVIRQGEDGDYYYYIRKGTCVVTHVGKSGKTIKLAELQAGRGFGEEALISSNKRNATVSMMTDGILMRLSKSDFEELLKEPILHKLSFEEARVMLAEKTAYLVDVRLESEYKIFNIKGSSNIPLFLLRLKAKDLDKEKTYITVCDNGKRSSSAAFLLNERGFNAYYVDGGLIRIKEILAAAQAKK